MVGCCLNGIYTSAPLSTKSSGGSEGAGPSHTHINAHTHMVPCERAQAPGVREAGCSNVMLGRGYCSQKGHRWSELHVCVCVPVFVVMWRR